MNDKHHPNYIINEQGERVSVVLPVAEYEALLEDLEDLARLAERRAEAVIDHEDQVAQLKTDSLL